MLSNLVMSLLPLRLTRLLLTSRCKKKDSLLPCFTKKELRTLNSARLSPFLLRTKRMLLLLLTTILTPLKLHLLLLLRLLPLRLPPHSKLLLLQVVPP